LEAGLAFYVQSPNPMSQVIVSGAGLWYFVARDDLESVPRNEFFFERHRGCQLMPIFAMNYRVALEPPLSIEDAAWAQALLRQRQLL
jgi:hypothetical protein